MFSASNLERSRFVPFPTSEKSPLPPGRRSGPEITVPVGRKPAQQPNWMVAMSFKASGAEFRESI